MPEAAPFEGEEIRTAASCRTVFLTVPSSSDFGAGVLGLWPLSQVQKWVGVTASLCQRWPSSISAPGLVLQLFPPVADIISHSLGGVGRQRGRERPFDNSKD